MENNDSSKLFSKTWLTVALIAVLFIVALGIRLLDLTDLPNDFYMTRQYGSLLIARGMYYAHLPSAPEWQKVFAIAQWKARGLIEPPIMESLAALTYRVIGEHIWVGRVYASLFWLAGGIALLLLAKDLSMRGGGIIALAYFLFLPFGMAASQAFMPDSLMTALIIWSLWSLYHWEINRSWKSAILAGVLTGVAILIKSVAVFPLLGAAVGLVLSRGSLKRIFADKQTWLVAGITVIPTAIFYYYGLFIDGTLGDQFGLRFFPTLLKDPSFYVRWLFIAAGIVGFTAMLISLAGILIFPTKTPRLMVIGGWIGYIVFGFAFPYHFLTHEYYHLPLIPIIAIGLIPVADLLIRQFTQQKSWFPGAMFAGLLLMGVGMQTWNERNSLVSTDYRPEVAYWQDLGNLIGHDKSIIELSGDYGYRLAYFGWVSGSDWPTIADDTLRTLAGQTQADFASNFADRIAGKDLFVITSPPEWQNQADLRDYLTTHYKLIDEGDGYWIFDLRQILP
jgi:hypothetical protein